MIKYFTIEDLLKHYLQKKFHILIQNEIVYKCTRDSGNALQNDIIDLIGHYFEVA